MIKQFILSGNLNIDFKVDFDTLLSASKMNGVRISGLNGHLKWNNKIFN